MKKAILVSREGGESRICLLASGKLVNIDAEGPSTTSLVGNIYKGRISDISRGLNAAFVDIGVGKEGFLSINDIHPGLLQNVGSSPRIGDIFSPGQEILVQVSRDAIGDKGAMLTTCVSLPGRYTVLIPSQEKVGISRKLPEEERQRLREMVEEVEIPEGFGVIVRTAGQSQKKEELISDLNSLSKLWTQIEGRYVQASAPSLLVQEPGVAVRFLRDYLTADVTEIVVDDEELYREILTFLESVMPKLKGILKLYQDKLPLFTRYSVERQVENMFVRDVWLPSGGRIVIDRTEALTAIDVNSGRARESNIEELALKTNLEAAEEIATQLVLRDLGGLIVIDFIDMDSATNRTKVYNRLKDCCTDDKAKLSFGKISQFGLLEMSRQRLRSGLLTKATEACRQCGGLGYHRTTSADALHIIRKVREMAVTGSNDVITVTAPVAVANFLQNTLRPLLHQLEQEHRVRLVILGEPSVYQSAVVGSKEAAAVQVVEEKPLDWPATLNGHPGTVRGDNQQEQPAPEPAAEVPATSGTKPARTRGRRSDRRDDDRWDSSPREKRAEKGPEKAPEKGQTREGGKPGEKAASGPKQAPAAKTPRHEARAEPRSEGREARADGRYDRPRPQRPQSNQPEPLRTQAPALRPADDDASRGAEKDGFLDSIIKKLLGLDR